MSYAALPSRILWLQGGVLGLAAVAVAVPPAQGPIMLVPVTTRAGATLVADAVGAQARLIGTGPLPGSIVVAGARDRLRASLGRAVLLVAAPPSGCRGATL